MQYVFLSFVSYFLYVFSFCRVFVCFSAAYDLSHIDRGLDQLHLNLGMSDQKQGSHDNVVFHNPVKTVDNSAWDDLRKVEQHYYANQTSQRLRVCIIPVFS